MAASVTSRLGVGLERAELGQAPVLATCIHGYAGGQEDGEQDKHDDHGDHSTVVVPAAVGLGTDAVAGAVALLEVDARGRRCR